MVSVIELACAEYGQDKVDLMVKATENGRSLTYFENPESLPSLQTLREKSDVDENKDKNPDSLEDTSAYNQLKVLMRRGFIKSKRDSVRQTNFSEIFTLI